MSLISLQDYLEVEESRQAFVVDELVPIPSFGLLLGPPKAGKSFLALGLALAVAQGVPWGRFSTRKGRVLYVQVDTSPATWRTQLCGVQAHHGPLPPGVLTPDPRTVPRPVDLGRKECREWLADALDEAKPLLVILDVLREFHRGDENDSTAMREVGDSLEPLARKCALLVLHHTRKIKEDVRNPDPVLYARGSSYWTGKADYFWLIYQNKLRVVPRWAEDRRIDMQRLPSGLWQVGPPPEAGAEYVTRIAAARAEAESPASSAVAARA